MPNRDMILGVSAAYYVSFETALAYHGLIPEAVFETTFATLKRPIEFENAFGRYRFRMVPAEIYRLGIERVTDSDVPFLIASPTKALRDRIALLGFWRSGFFGDAAFYGGTALRIFHGLNRFSEELGRRFTRTSRITIRLELDMRPPRRSASTEYRSPTVPARTPSRPGCVGGTSR